MINTMKKYCLVIIFALISGCATAPIQEASKIFYPEPPELPRMQYLTSFTGEKDIVAKKSAFETFITGVGQGKARLDKPYGVAIWDGKIYVCDTNHGVIVFDLEKKTYSELQGARGMGKLLQPVNIRIAADGTKYVSDPVRGQVVVFDKNDFFVTAFGGPDTWKPVDAVPYGDELYVVDTKNFQIVVTDKKSGNIVRQNGHSGPPDEQLGRPTNLAFDKDGHLFVSDIGRFQVLKYDRDGHFLGVVGEIGVEHGTFARPKGIAIDREQRLYVVDAAFANVQIFDKDGDIVFFFGVSGKYPGNLNLPAQVIVDYDNIKYFQQYADNKFEIENLVFVVSQFGGRMVNIYAMGRERGKVYPTDAELLEQMKAKLEKAAKEKSAGETGGPNKEKP
jgi:sugar lactone lactonase YvrE